jgi:uncharacterized protein (DUF1501 family)
VAAPSDRPRFLLVFLRGGYDALDLLVPSSSSYYYEVRPNIAVARPSSRPDSAIPIGGGWAVAPALRNTLLPLLEGRALTFIPFAGTHDASRSHFETQDSMELGQPLDGRRDFGSGFLNRLAAELGARGDCIAFTDQVPLVFRGAVEVANVSLKSTARSGLDERAKSLLLDLYRGRPLSTNVREGFEVRDEVEREMATRSETASRQAVTPKGFELEARRVARLMRERYAVGFLDVGGWDTHVNQGSGTGYLATRLEELSRGLVAFAEDMETTWRQTIVVVVSEFGRTVRENGNRGTDHGHGSVHWILGGALGSGPVVGEQVAVSATTLFQSRDLPVLNEYRSVISGILRRQYGLSAAALQRVFPGAQAVDLGIT